MTNPVNFADSYFAKVADLIDVIQELRLLNDRVAADSGLVVAYFANPVHRTDINAADFANAQSAVTQMLFTFDSGSPTQKSYLFKTL